MSFIPLKFISDAQKPFSIIAHSIFTEYAWSPITLNFTVCILTSFAFSPTSSAYKSGKCSHQINLSKWSQFAVQIYSIKTIFACKKEIPSLTTPLFWCVCVFCLSCTYKELAKFPRMIFCVSWPGNIFIRKIIGEKTIFFHLPYLHWLPFGYLPYFSFSLCNSRILTPTNLTKWSKTNVNKVNRQAI